MAKLVNNYEEEINLKSFSSLIAEKTYRVYGLKDAEATLIKKYFIKVGARILDLGCGYGRTTKPLYKAGFEVIGIDIAPKMIEAAQQDNPQIKFLVMSATDLRFPDNSFDYLFFSFNGLDYIYPEERRFLALKEASRVLKPDGLFILSSHNKASFFFRIFSELSFYNLKTFLTSVFNGQIFTHYLKSRHQEGDLVEYVKTPYRQKKDFAKYGFEVLEVFGKKYKNWLAINLFEGRPHFVLRKK